MNRFTVRGRVFAAIALFGLSAGTLLTSCEKHNEGPDGSVCSIAATVVDKAGTGLVLQLTDGSYVVPTGATWTSFQAKAGEAVTVGYSTKKGNCGSSKNATTNGQSVELGCITATSTTTTDTSGGSGTGAN